MSLKPNIKICNLSPFLQIYEQKIIYDGKNPDIECSIERQNEGKNCEVSQIPQIVCSLNLFLAYLREELFWCKKNPLKYAYGHGVIEQLRERCSDSISIIKLTI